MGLGMNSVAAMDALTQISGELEAMQGVIDNLQRETLALQGRWDGDARVAFSEAMKKAEDSLAALRHIASQATSQAIECLETFQAFDRRRESVWKL